MTYVAVYYNPDARTRAGSEQVLPAVNRFSFPPAALMPYDG